MSSEIAVVCIKLLLGSTGLAACAVCVVWIDLKGLMMVRERGIGPRADRRVEALFPAVDALKLLLKGNRLQPGTDRLFYILGPLLALAIALSMWIAVPVGFGSGLEILGVPTEIISLAPDLEAGLVLTLAIAALTAFPVVFAGWSRPQSSSSVHAACMALLAYFGNFLALVVSVVGVATLAGSVHLQTIVASQSGWWLVGVPRWNLCTQPLAAAVFAVSALTIIRQYISVDGASPLNSGAGLTSAYGGVLFGTFRISHTLLLVAYSALFTTLFLGGYTLPGVPLLPGWFGACVSILIFVAKTTSCIVGCVWVGWAFPRITSGRLHSRSTKVLLPMAILNLFMTAVASALDWV